MFKDRYLHAECVDNFPTVTLSNGPPTITSTSFSMNSLTWIVSESMLSVKIKIRFLRMATLWWDKQELYFNKGSDDKVVFHTVLIKWELTWCIIVVRSGFYSQRNLAWPMSFFSFWLFMLTEKCDTVLVVVTYFHFRLILSLPGW